MENEWTRQDKEKMPKLELKTGLSRDLWNAVMSIDNGILILNNPKSKKPLEKVLRPIVTFEEYISKYGDDEAKRIKANSNPEAVRSFDLLVGEYNKQIEEIIKSRDIEKLKVFSGRFMKLILGDLS